MFTRNRSITISLLGAAVVLGNVSAEEDRQMSRDFLSIPGKALLGFYGKVLRETLPTHCPMTPSCSGYSKEAFQKRGPILGVLLTGDRLMRCGHDVTHYKKKKTPQGRRYEDPIP
jgi:putative component of membrane protein insertase Oxa1/YidC/SpoIIIJ protein YidD